MPKAIELQEERTQLLMTLTSYSTNELLLQIIPFGVLQKEVTKIQHIGVLVCGRLRANGFVECMELDQLGGLIMD